jgi:V/A-type H+-transporting ATPase subunit G/H
MYAEVIKSITDAEEAARQEKQNALARAKSRTAEAEKKGLDAMTKAAARAEEDVRRLLCEAEQKAAEAEAELQNVTSQQQAEIRRQAESRLNEAADFIVERIVHG